MEVRNWCGDVREAGWVGGMERLHDFQGEEK